MEQLQMERVRRLAEAGTPGVGLSLLEIRAVFSNGFDLDAVSKALDAQEPKICGCDGENCPGVRVMNADGQMLMIPTLAAIAARREMTPVEYIDSQLVERQLVADRAVELYVMIEDAGGPDELDDLDLESEDEEVLDLLREIRAKMKVDDILSMVGDAISEMRS